VLVRGPGDLLWRNSHNGQSWSGWFQADAAMQLNGPPDCVSVEEGEADCAVQGFLNRVFYSKITTR